MVIDEVGVQRGTDFTRWDGGCGLKRRLLLARSKWLIDFTRWDGGCGLKPLLTYPVPDTVMQFHPLGWRVWIETRPFFAQR